MEKFTVGLPVYKSDNPEDFRTAVRSVYNQTIKPDEIIVVVDGPIPDTLKTVLAELQKEIPILRPVWLEKNMGHCIARQTYVNEARNKYVAGMDSDDIANPRRFELELEYLEKHPNVDIVGGQMSEFIGDPKNIVGYRNVPLTNEEIYEYMKKRCALNHVTVMFRKDSIIKVGNYQNWPWQDDYYLWVRMMIAGCTFANIPETVMNVRVGEGMYSRRGGWKYFKSEKGIQDLMLKNKLISWPLYLFNVTVRFIVQVAMPNKLRGFMFRHFFRSR